MEVNSIEPLNHLGIFKYLTTDKCTELRKIFNLATARSKGFDDQSGQSLEDEWCATLTINQHAELVGAQKNQAGAYLFFLLMSEKLTSRKAIQDRLFNLETCPISAEIYESIEERFAVGESPMRSKDFMGDITILPGSTITVEDIAQILILAYSDIAQICPETTHVATPMKVAPALALA